MFAGQFLVNEPALDEETSSLCPSAANARPRVHSRALHQCCEKSKTQSLRDDTNGFL